MFYVGYWYWKINGFHRFRKSYKKIQRNEEKKEGKRYKMKMNILHKERRIKRTTKEQQNKI